MASAALSYLFEQTLFFIGGNSVHLYGWPFWFVNHYHDDLTGPGAYVDPSAFVLDILFWSCVAFAVLSVVLLLQRFVTKR